jgi:hypothetical protein
MRGKLTLKLDDLSVDSFDTSAGRKTKGTVFGEQCTCYTQCTCPGCPTCVNTCDATCANTCDDYTCANSCNGTCGGATCGGASCYESDCCPASCLQTACGPYFCCA